MDVNLKELDYTVTSFYKINIQSTLFELVTYAVIYLIIFHGCYAIS